MCTNICLKFPQLVSVIRTSELRDEIDGSSNEGKLTFVLLSPLGGLSRL